MPLLAPKDDAVEDDILVVVGEAERDAVAPAHQPAAAELRRPAVEPRLQLRIDRAHQTRTSTTGIDGISPAANPARLALIRSVSNRTGTSNSKPAVTGAPAAGAAARCTCPVGVIDRETGPGRQRHARRPPPAPSRRPASRSAAHRPAPPSDRSCPARTPSRLPSPVPSRLVERRRRRRGRAGLEVGPVLPAEPVELPVPRLEEGDQLGQVVQRPHARAPRRSAAANAPRASCAPRSRCSASTISVRRSGPPLEPTDSAAGNLTSWKFIACPPSEIAPPALDRAAHLGRDLALRPLEARPRPASRCSSSPAPRRRRRRPGRRACRRRRGVSGMIASGPASPISPTPPRIGNCVGPSTTPPRAKAATRPAPNAAPLANGRTPPRIDCTPLPTAEPIAPCTGASAWFSTEPDRLRPIPASAVRQPLAVEDHALERPPQRATTPSATCRRRLAPGVLHAALHALQLALERAGHALEPGERALEARELRLEPAEVAFEIRHGHSGSARSRGLVGKARGELREARPRQRRRARRPARPSASARPASAPRRPPASAAAAPARAASARTRRSASCRRRPRRAA